MGTKTSPRRDEDEEDERPRKRRRAVDDDEDDDRPRSRRARENDDEDDDRPRPRPKRKSRGPSTGRILAIVGGGLAIVGVVVGIVLLARAGAGGAKISYAKYQEIRGGATIDSLEKSFGKSTNVERSEWSKIKLSDETIGGRQAVTLADLSHNGLVDSWHRWNRGSEAIYVGVGRDFKGNSGPTWKVYTNSNAKTENALADDDASDLVPEFEVAPINWWSQSELGTIQWVFRVPQVESRVSRVSRVSHIPPDTLDST